MERDRLYHPRQIDEIEGSGVSLINEPPPPENVGVVVPMRPRSLHSLIAQNLADVEGLIGRLEGGVAVAASGRELVRELYIGCRKQREVLSAALRLEGIE
jgi:hypothetical protein